MAQPIKLNSNTIANEIFKSYTLPTEFFKDRNGKSVCRIYRVYRAYRIAILKNAEESKNHDVNPGLQYRNSGKSLKRDLNRGLQYRNSESANKR